MIIRLVRFTPGARTNWHSHAFGQTLRATDRIGVVQIREGDVRPSLWSDQIDAASPARQLLTGPMAFPGNANRMRHSSPLPIGGDA
jgi:hypothetical protein